jgi:hypothetical protein
MAMVYNGSHNPCHESCVIWSAQLVRYLTSAILLLCLAASGCVRVRAHQRQNLAKRAMTDDRDKGEARFGQHATGSREGADGGTGQPGGGCGCN